MRYEVMTEVISAFKFVGQLYWKLNSIKFPAIKLIAKEILTDKQVYSQKLGG